MQVGGVEEQVRKPGVVQRPAPKRRHGLEVSDVLCKAVATY
jgi:hypothetical protein